MYRDDVHGVIGIGGNIGISRDLPDAVDGRRHAKRAAQGAQVGHLAVAVQNGMQFIRSGNGGSAYDRSRRVDGSRGAIRAAQRADRRYIAAGVDISLHRRADLPACGRAYSSYDLTGGVDTYGPHPDQSGKRAIAQVDQPWRAAVGIARDPFRRARLGQHAQVRDFIVAGEVGAVATVPMAVPAASGQRAKTARRQHTCHSQSHESSLLFRKTWGEIDRTGSLSGRTLRPKQGVIGGIHDYYSPIFIAFLLFRNISFREQTGQAGSRDGFMRLRKDSQGGSKHGKYGYNGLSVGPTKVSATQTSRKGSDVVEVDPTSGRGRSCGRFPVRFSSSRC